jgi:CheY-like chemotaxis protein
MGPTRILLVDDEKHIRLLFKEVLEEEGYLIDLASDGFEALEKLKNQSFAIVVLDLRMPDMDGIETLTEIKRLNSDQRVVLCSASDNRGPDLSGWTLVGYAAKSSDMKELKFAIKSLSET